MKKIHWLFPLMVFLTACSMVNSNQKLYEVRMMSGDSLYAKSKPTLEEDGYYRFNDVNKQRYIINKDLVLFIEPTSFKK